MDDEVGGKIGCGVLVGLQLVTYVMSFIRWFGTEHDTFWFGFKELLWALCPIANFGYVWDWWFAAILFVFYLGKEAIDAIESK